MKSNEFTAAQQEFVDQMTRKLLVDWCLLGVDRHGEVLLDARMKGRCFIEHAVSKKWLSPKEEHPDGLNTYKILSAGWQTAARFLKR